MDSGRIEQLLSAAFPQAKVSVSSEDNVHFTAKVIDAGFEGLSRLERHRRAHAAVGPALGREIHALTLSLKSPEEDAAG